MTVERKLTFIYFVLGLGMGVLSIYLNSIVSLGIGIAIYLISFFVTKRLIARDKNFTWYLTNTLLTFALVWLITWIFIFNL